MRGTKNSYENGGNIRDSQAHGAQPGIFLRARVKRNNNRTFGELKFDRQTRVRRRVISSDNQTSQMKLSVYSQSLFFSLIKKKTKSRTNKNKKKR